MVCFQKNRRGKERFSHLACHCRGGTVASSSFLILFLCGNDGTQQSIAGSGRIQAPFHCMPMLITHNNHRRQGQTEFLPHSDLPVRPWRAKLEQCRGLESSPRGLSDNNLRPFWMLPCCVNMRSFYCHLLTMRDGFNMTSLKFSFSEGEKRSTWGFPENNSVLLFLTGSVPWGYAGEKKKKRFMLQILWTGGVV